VKVKNSLVFTLPGSIHDKSYQLINIQWMSIAENGKDSMVSIGSGLCMQSKFGISGKGARFLEKMSNAVLPG
jgi:hypothetical protein